MSEGQRADAWPADGLETIDRCPICAGRDRDILHADLRDDVFYVAPGSWAMWKCRGCGSGYLDPRPDQRTIGLAYSNYYTHSPAEVPKAETAIERLRNMVGNDYRNATYGTRYGPTLPGGRIVTALTTSIKRRIDLEFRFLPSRTKAPRKVLDVGCGNGGFLRLARDAGWEALGVEPDPCARAVATQAGFEVRPSLGDWANRGTFGFVTFSHVIEHLHDPAASVRDAFQLLSHGGRIYIDTPNINAPGRRIYGAAWRGLEPPRHLVLFSKQSLLDVLEQAGFRNPRFISRPDVVEFLTAQSRMIAQRQNQPALPHYHHEPSGPEENGAPLDTEEFLTVIAEKA